MRFAITAFIAGGSLLLFLSQVPDNWVHLCVFIGVCSILAVHVFPQLGLVKKLAVLSLLFAVGFAWNARYAESRLENILSAELEGKEFTLTGRVAVLPQVGPLGAKFLRLRLIKLALEKRP
ncbi:hypothetical protein [Polynucleobacter necessarius]|uniref:hypothetical protein n=1 Tax=Polynucleobacter necessarius TaxID=576610 RepID=UPI000E842C71|nr:hypothetical protein [Polynucleobacter necessarius]HAT38661.1 hypothetical protein [Polynucleobacter sp.]